MQMSSGSLGGDVTGCVAIGNRCDSICIKDKNSSHLSTIKSNFEKKNKKIEKKN